MFVTVKRSNRYSSGIVYWVPDMSRLSKRQQRAFKLMSGDVEDSIIVPTIISAIIAAIAVPCIAVGTRNAWLLFFWLLVPCIVCVGLYGYRTNDRRRNLRTRMASDGRIFHSKDNDLLHMARKIIHDDDVMERHPDMVTQFLRDPDLNELVRLKDEASWEMRSKIEERLIAKSQALRLLLLKLDEPYQDERRRQEDEERERTNQVRLDQQARQAAIDEHLRWILGEPNEP